MLPKAEVCPQRIHRIRRLADSDNAPKESAGTIVEQFRVGHHRWVRGHCFEHAVRFMFSMILQRRVDRYLSFDVNVGPDFKSL